jgi:hypothetical protein
MKFLEGLKRRPDASKMTAEQDVEGLTRLLDHTDHEMRKAAVNGLSAIADPRKVDLAVTYLLFAVNDAEEDVRVAARTALEYPTTTVMRDAVARRKLRLGRRGP